MPIVSAVCTSFWCELLAQQPHRREDDYRLALFTAAADLGPHTRRYTPEGEAQGEGYAAGGIALGPPRLGRDRPFLTWTGEAVWPEATLTAAGALIYNATREGRAIAVLDFGRDVTSTRGEFVVPLPTLARPLVQIAVPTQS